MLKKIRQAQALVHRPAHRVHHLVQVQVQVHHLVQVQVQVQEAQAQAQVVLKVVLTTLLHHYQLIKDGPKPLKLMEMIMFQ